MVTAVILTIAAFAQLADTYTWKLLLGRAWEENGYLYQSVELNPIVNALPPAAPELLKLALIVWLLAFASLATSTRRWSVLPQIIGVIIAGAGLFGAISNVRAVL